MADGGIALLALMTAVSLGVSPDPRRSLVAAVMVWVGLLLYLLLAHWAWVRPRWDWLWWGLVALGGFLFVVAPPAMLPADHPLFRWLPWWGRLRDLLGDTFNPNVIAGAVALLLPFGLAKTLALGCSRAPADRAAAWGAGLIVLAMAALLVLTWSRAAYLALAIGLWLMGALYRPRVLVPLAMAILAGLVLGASIFGWDQVAQAFESSFLLGGWGKRLELWSRGLHLVARFPLTGVGLDCFVPVTTQLYPLPSWAEGRVYHVHNLFLQLAVDLGLPGLLAYLVVLAWSMRQAWGAWHGLKRAGRREEVLLAAACVASLAVLIVQGLLDVALWGNKGAFLPWVVLGLSALLSRLAQEPAPASTLNAPGPRGS